MNHYLQPMKTYEFLCCKILIVFCVLSFCNSCARQHPEKPNIVFIMADDMGYGDVSCYNQESKIQIPYADKMASEGLMFTIIMHLLF